MQNQLIFQGQKELERLAVQNRLLSLYEKPVVDALFSEGSNWTVLDIGCNDGLKTTRRFSSPGIRRVVGLEYNEALAQAGQKQYGNEKFTFHHCDVETPDFSEQLQRLCARENIQGFDVIYLSFVLMHLSDPVRLLKRLKPFLNEGGRLLVVEPNDADSKLEPDPQGLLPGFLQILSQDEYAGNRQTGIQLPQLLRQAGYEDLTLWQEGISAEAGEVEKKQDMFETFFSYLPEDVQLLESQEPENARYQSWETWLRENFENFKEAVTRHDARIHMGIQMISCRKGSQ